MTLLLLLVLLLLLLRILWLLLLLLLSLVFGTNSLLAEDDLSIEFEQRN